MAETTIRPIPASWRRSHRGIFNVLLILALFTPISLPVDAQVVTGTITGIVTDPSGARVPNATITATNEGNGVSQSTTTTADGIYNLPYLPPGTYTITVEAGGFAKATEAGVLLDVSMVQRVNTTLKPGSAQEIVSVSSAAPLLQTEGAEVSQTFDAQTVRELPIANRNVQAVAGLLPGVTPPVQSDTATEDPQATTLFNANGQGNTSNNTIVDGVDNLDPLLGLSIVSAQPGTGPGSECDHQQLQRRVWQSGRRGREHHHAIGNQPVSRQCLGVQSGSRSGCPRLISIRRPPANRRSSATNLG